MSIIDTVASTANLCRTLLQSPDAKVPRQTLELICKEFIALAEAKNAMASQVANAQAGMVGARLSVMNSAANDLNRARR